MMRTIESYFDHPINKILIFRPLYIGDLLCTVPVLRALRKHFPLAEISIVGLPWTREFAARFREYIADVIPFPGFPGLPEKEPDILAFPQFLKDVQARQYDLALQLLGNGTVINPLMLLLGARKTAGFFNAAALKADDTYFPCPEHLPEIQRQLKLLEYLGIPTDGDHLEFPLYDEDRAAFSQLRARFPVLEGPYICVHPGARLKTRRWDPSKFAFVADQLAKRGYPVVITGTPAEKDVTAAVVKAMITTPLDLTGQTSLGTLGLLLKHSRVLISNDTGVSHVAAALKVPSVIIMTGSDPKRWRPTDQGLHKAVFFDGLSCRPCFYETCPFGMPCSANISPYRVIDQALHLLNQKEGALAACNAN